MRIFIQGIYVPNTNEWWVDSGWTFADLRADVVKILTAKTGNPEGYDCLVDGEVMDPTSRVSGFVSEGGDVWLSPRS